MTAHKHEELYKFAQSLEIAVARTLHDVGCAHNADFDGRHYKHRVPIETAVYQPLGQLVWVPIRIDCLPPAFPPERLIELNVAAMVSDRLGAPVKLFIRGREVLFVSQLVRSETVH